MQTIRKSYRGLSLLIDLNGDFLGAVIALSMALAIGAYVLSGGGDVPMPASI